MDLTEVQQRITHALEDLQAAQQQLQAFKAEGDTSNAMEQFELQQLCDRAQDLATGTHFLMLVVQGVAQREPEED